MNTYQKLLEQLSSLNPSTLYQKDFFLTWEKTIPELNAIFTTADCLRILRENNLSARVFDSGLAVSNFRDNSTRTRFSFASACNLLGLAVQDLEEGKSQLAHGETVKETANMISFMAEVIGIRDDKFIGKGNAYMHEAAAALDEGFQDGILKQRPTLVNLQCDIDHPTQCMADTLHLIHKYDGLKNLHGKKIAMSWAYSPSYGKPLSVPQGIIGLLTRFGMDVVLAHPKGYEVMPEITELAKKQAKDSGGSFTETDSMEEAFQGADIVYPKSWAPYESMLLRSDYYSRGEFKKVEELELDLLEQNAAYKNWTCTKKLMQTTKNGSALYLHCLPADISQVSCEHGEVDACVFDEARTSLYQQASYKPYIIAAMILLSRFKDPVSLLSHLYRRNSYRKDPL